MRWTLCLLLGCMPDPDGSVVLHGRHVTVHVEPTIPICANAIAAADRFVEDTAAMLGIPTRHIDYYVIDGPTGCGYGQYTGASCTMGSTVYSNAWIHYHELVHAVDNSHPPAVFAEGVAEALTTPLAAARQSTLARATAEIDFDSPAFRAGIPGDEYAIAGNFVRFVLEKFGGERYQTFARSVVSLSDPVSLRRQFSHVFGVTLDEVVAEWRGASAADAMLTVPADLIECQDPIAPVAPDTWRVDDVQPDSCATGTTERGAIYSQPSGRYGFEVTTPGMFVVEAFGTRDNQRGMVRSCAADARFAYRISGATRRFAAMSLRAGRHAIEMADGAQTWSVSRLDGTGASCETAATFLAPDREHWELELRGAPLGWIRIEHDRTRALYGTADSATASRACWGACDRLECQSIAEGAVIEAPPGLPLYIVPGASSSEATSVVVKTIARDDT